MISDAAAAIVAGGAGTRLGGVAKALLDIGGRTILERQLDALRPLFSEIFVVANDPAPFASSGLAVVADRIAGKGAPGGVHAALSTSKAGWVFCLASDMPFVSAAPIELLAARRGTAPIVAPERNGFPEPLFAFYRRDCLDSFTRALQQGNPSLTRLLRELGADLAPEAELARVDPGLRSLDNVNTPEDLERARR